MWTVYLSISTDHFRIGVICWILFFLIIVLIFLVLFFLVSNSQSIVKRIIQTIFLVSVSIYVDERRFFFKYVITRRYDYLHDWKWILVVNLTQISFLFFLKKKRHLRIEVFEKHMSRQFTGISLTWLNEQKLWKKITKIGNIIIYWLSTWHWNRLSLIF